MSVSLKILPASTSTGGGTSLESAGGRTERVHDFRSKLLQPEIFDSLKQYVLWQHEMRKSKSPEELLAHGPTRGPFSINLDLTTACNYECGHCIDLNILNTGIRHDHNKLKDSLAYMISNGLRSVILIGGGEPTVDPKFEDIVTFLKERQTQVAVVTNGSMMRKVGNVAHLFRPNDWVRLSLDSGTDATFQAMHRPKRPITLDRICDNVKEIRDRNDSIQIGFSYIVTWNGAHTNGQDIVPNLHEIPLAAQLARDHGFSYLSVKPFLDRAENNAETIGISQEEREYRAIIEQIKAYVGEAKSFETPRFRVIESANLRALENGSHGDCTKQPRNCHMTYFRQVVSPLGTFICPVYRDVKRASVGGKEAYLPENAAATHVETAKRISDFDASVECRNVTCLYNDANWFVESLIEDPSRLDALAPVAEQDHFL